MIPKDIDGSTSKLIYLYLENAKEPKNPRQICEELDMKMLSVLPVLSRMRKQDCIEKIDERDMYDICREE